MTKGELTKVTTTWIQAHFGAVISGSLRVICTSSDETRMKEEVGHSSQNGDPVEVRKFFLNDVRGPVCTAQKVTIPHFSTGSVHANFSVKGHCMVGPGTHGTNATSPVACSGGIDSDLQGITSGVLQGTNLSVHLEHPYHGNSLKGCGWAGCPCQPSATGSLPNQDFQRGKLQTPKGMGLGDPGPPRSPRMARIRVETDQRVVAQMGTPVCAQWPGPRQNCSDQTQNRGDRLDTPQRVLPMYTSPHVQWHEGPYQGDAGYWCYLKVTLSRD